MELRSIRLINFRGYRDLKITFSNGLQMLVGKNDIGKSTIFEALDIFFNGKDANVKLSIDDFNVQAKNIGEASFSIVCEFELTEREEILVETVKIDPQKEFLLNSKGYIEIKKEWTKDSLKEVTYIVCNLPKQIPAEILTMKQADLKRKIKELHLESSTNQTINSSMRQAIYRYYAQDSSEMTESTIPTKNALAEKDIYDNIAKSFPDFYLFKADRKNSTTDEEIQNPMSIAVKRAFESPDVSSKVEEIQQIVLKQLNEINAATIEKLSALGVDYGSKLNARVTANWASAIKNDILDGNEIPINKRGSGIRRLLLLSYLMVEAEKKSYEQNKKDIIYAIEEPETALHPYMQQIFIKQLIELSQANRCNFGDEMPSNANELNHYQIFMTTHLPNFIAYANIDQIIYLHRDINGRPLRYTEKNLTEIIQQEMGKFPIIDYKFIIFVEGVNDVNALQNFGKIPELKAIFDLSRKDVAIIPLKGGNLKKCIEMDYYWDLPVKQYHLYDSDIASYKTDIIDKRCNLDTNRLVRGRITTLKEMENYIPIPLIETRIGLALSTYYSKWHNQDFSITDTLLSQPDTSCPQFVSIKNQKSNFSDKEKDLKAFLNKTILRGVTKEQLEAHQVYSEIKDWFTEMKNLYEYRE